MKDGGGPASPTKAGIWPLHEFLLPKVGSRVFQRSGVAAHSDPDSTKERSEVNPDLEKDAIDAEPQTLVQAGEDVERQKLIEQVEAEARASTPRADCPAERRELVSQSQEEAQVLAPRNVVCGEDVEGGHGKSAQRAATEPSIGGWALKLMALAAVAFTASALIVVGARGAWSSDGGSKLENRELGQGARGDPGANTFTKVLEDLLAEQRPLVEPPQAQEVLLWEVTAGRVDVRDRPSDSGRQLGTKQHGARFLGDIGSGWINLTRESGFVKVVRDGSYQLSVVNRTECSDAGKDCSSTKCCRWPGHTCFQKHEGHARCRPSCTKGPDPTDVDSRPWSCEALGMTTAGEPKEVELPAAAWVKDECTGSRGWSCQVSMCCSEPGFQCFEHGEGNATCERRCKPTTTYRFSAEIDWCQPLGGRTPDAGSAPSAAFLSFPLQSEQ